MATILKLVAQGKIPPYIVISWLKKNFDDDTSQMLYEYDDLQHEFVPYFLNYLRYQTIHLLQNNKNTNLSPAKTPHLNSVKSDDSGGHIGSSDSKCSADSETIVVSPDTFYLSNNNKDPSDKRNCQKLVNNYKDECQQKNENFLPNSQANVCKSPVQGQTHDNQRAKQKLSFGEFFKPLDVSKQKKKVKTNLSREGSPYEFITSPSCLVKKRNFNKKKRSCQNISINGQINNQDTQVFSLLSFSDFPPVSAVCSPSADIKSQIKPANTDMNSVGRSTETSKNPSRRIKPTFLQQDCKKPLTSTFLNAPVENKPKTCSSSRIVEDDGKLTFREERELLRQMKAKQDITYKTPSKQISTQVTSFMITPSRLDHFSEFVVANPEEVTNKDVLDLLVELYSGCLQEHLFPNVIQELYFLTQLLTARGREVTLDPALETEEIIYFATVHNAVYFAVSVMEKQISIIKLLDKSTIKFLCDNHRVTTFSPKMHDQLECISNANNNAKKTTCFPQIPIGGVSFQADTDNRKNFPSDKSFHQFKKQRDMFYELIREWELKHEVAGWSLMNMMGNRIRSLVEFQTDLADHLHFARLFQSQLIAMCKGDQSIKINRDDEKISLLNHLKKTNPEKFKKLQERFIQPFSTGGPCPTPRFHGHEEFFRDFIVSASSSTFNQHLSNTFVSKVEELNEQEFGHSTDKQDASLLEDGEQEREMFECCLLTLRLIGKFLGFLTFHPYSTTDPLPDVVQTNYLIQRNKNPPPLDLTMFVKKAVLSKRLVVTIPWVIEYLSMMDYAAPLTDYYHSLLSLLIHVLRQSWVEIQKGQNCYGHFLIVVLIEWLLENTRTLGGLFFKEISSDVLLLGSDLDGSGPVDIYHLVTQELLYICCPYAGEMRSLLMEFAIGTNCRSAIRKITPVAADTGLAVTASQKQIQSQLEENFFHNHPASLKRTVEFVAERTASNFIKRFRSTLLPKSLSEAKSRVEQIFHTTVQSSSNKTKDKVSHELYGLAQTITEEVKTKIADKLEFCHDKISKIMPLLLPEEQSGAVVSVASSISCRLAEERITLWFNMHITESMYLKELTTELDRLTKADLLNKSKTNTTETSVIDSSNFQTENDIIKEKLAQSKENYAHKMLPESAIPLSEILVDIKYVVRNVLLSPDEPIELDKTNRLLTEAYNTLNFRKDILTQATKCLSQLLLDVVLAVICEKSHKIDNPVIHQCIKLWKECLESVTELQHICSPRILYSLAKSRHPEISWKKYAEFVILLLENKLLTPSSFQDSCSQLVQKSETYKEEFGQCLCLIIEHFKQLGSDLLCLNEMLDKILITKQKKTELSDKNLDASLSKQKTGHIGEDFVTEVLDTKKENFTDYDNTQSMKWTELFQPKETSG